MLCKLKTVIMKETYWSQVFVPSQHVRSIMVTFLRKNLNFIMKRVYNSYKYHRSVDTCDRCSIISLLQSRTINIPTIKSVGHKPKMSCYQNETLFPVCGRYSSSCHYTQGV